MEDMENGGNIAHASHYGPLHKKGTCLKRLSARLWQPAAALFPIVKEKKPPAHIEKQKETHNTDNRYHVSTPEPRPEIYLHAAHKHAQVSKISRER